MGESRVVLVKAGTLVDGDSTLLAPGAIVLASTPVGWNVLALGTIEEVSRHPAAAHAEVLDRSASVVCPALVNAHTHLDLTHIGPWQMPEMGGFDHFIAKIRSERKLDDAGIRASVALGVEASRRGGVVAVGDIAGAAGGLPQLGPWRELRASGLFGTSYVEFFAIGNGEPRGIAAISEAIERGMAEQNDGKVQLGIHPHAPYSVSIAGYRTALSIHQKFGIPICTHAAESLAEREFIETGGGPLRVALERIGMWDHMPEGIGEGFTPLARLRAVDPAGKIGLVHVNDLSDADLNDLPVGAAVMYCPRSSEYFGAERVFGPHRYRDLIRRGIKVALGTDSIVNLLDQTGEKPRISTWDEMRLLHRRDGTDARLLLTMATIWGAQAIGCDPELFRLRAGGRVIDLIGVEFGSSGDSGLASALQSDSLPTLLLHEK